MWYFGLLCILWSWVFPWVFCLGFFSCKIEIKLFSPEAWTSMMYWCKSCPCWMTSKVMLFMASFRSVWRCNRCSARVRSSVLKSFICLSRSSFQASSSAVTFMGRRHTQDQWNILLSNNVCIWKYFAFWLWSRNLRTLDPAHLMATLHIFLRWGSMKRLSVQRNPSPSFSLTYPKWHWKRIPTIFSLMVQQMLLNIFKLNEKIMLPELQNTLQPHNPKMAWIFLKHSFCNTFYVTYHRCNAQDRNITQGLGESSTDPQMRPGCNQRPASNSWEHTKSSLLSLLPNCDTQADDFSSPFIVSSVFYTFLHRSQLVSKSSSFACAIKARSSAPLSSPVSPQPRFCCCRQKRGNMLVTMKEGGGWGKWELSCTVQNTTLRRIENY